MVNTRDYRLRHRLIGYLQNRDIKGIRWIAHRLPHLLIPVPEGPVVMRTIQGFRLRIDPVKDRGVERSIYYTGTYEKGTLNIIRHLLPWGGIFVDVGANIGLMSVFASILAGDEGKVYAFEPHPATADLLEENIALNGCRNIEVSRKAIGASGENAHIYERWDSNRGSASLIKPDFDTRSHEVEMTTLTDYFRGLPKPDLVKIDIEGYEPAALKGARGILEIDNPPAMIIEYSGDNASLQDNVHPEDNVSLQDNVHPGDNVSLQDNVHPGDIVSLQDNVHPGDIVSPENNDSRDIFSLLTEEYRYRLFRLRRGKNRRSPLVEITGEAEMPVGDNIFCFHPTHLQKMPGRLIRTP